DVPIEARMVSKAIERAQATVESRNAEIRKDVLKYDEVNHEQRKVIYARRMQVLDGEDLRERTIEILEDTLDGLVRAACPNDYQEEWDLSGLLAEVALVYPTRFTPEELNEATDADQVYESLRAEAVAYYEEKEAGLPGGADTMRQLERDIMLQIIDLRWREHLAEMDYLREGINLRAMGQQDPLVAWQREGFTMFGQLMDAIDEDYLRYVMHAEVQIQAAPEPDLESLQYQGPADPVRTPSEAMTAEAPIEAAALGPGENGPDADAAFGATVPDRPSAAQPPGAPAPNGAVPDPPRPAAQSRPAGQPGPPAQPGLPAQPRPA